MEHGWVINRGGWSINRLGRYNNVERKATPQIIGLWSVRVMIRAGRLASAGGVDRRRVLPRAGGPALSVRLVSRGSANTGVGRHPAGNDVGQRREEGDLERVLVMAPVRVRRRSRRHGTPQAVEHGRSDRHEGPGVSGRVEGDDVGCRPCQRPFDAA